ncbi:unnamed protein product [Ixodes hexagonus]
MIHHHPSVFVKAIHQVFYRARPFHSASGRGAAGRSPLTKTRRRSYYVPTVVGLSLAIPAVWYSTLDSTSKRYVRTSLGGVRRFMKTLGIGLTISCDYSYSLWGCTEGTEEYKTAMKACHQRGANRILSGCLANGGLYIKLGQSLVALNHLLPREYLDTLEVLHDQALVRVGDEVIEYFASGIACQEKMYRRVTRSVLTPTVSVQGHPSSKGDPPLCCILSQDVICARRMAGQCQAHIPFISPFPNLRSAVDFVKREGVRCITSKIINFLISFVVRLRCSRKTFLLLPWIPSPIPYHLWNAITFCSNSDSNNERLGSYDGATDAATVVGTKTVREAARKCFINLHCDCPTVVFVQKGADGKARIVLLDHGLYEDISKENRLSLCQLWRAIIMNDQAAMKVHSLELGVSNYPVFCEILMQRPLQRSTLRMRNRLSSEDIAYMRSMVQGHFDEVMDCIRSLPRPMLLVFRQVIYGDGVRSITKNHGHPVDRFTLMARIATRRLASSQDSGSFRVMLQRWWSYFMFECRLR